MLEMLDDKARSDGAGLKGELLVLVNNFAAQQSRHVQAMDRLVSEQRLQFTRTIEALIGDSSCVGQDVAVDHAIDLPSLKQWSSASHDRKNNAENRQSTDTVSARRSAPVARRNRVFDSIDVTRPLRQMFRASMDSVVSDRVSASKSFRKNQVNQAYSKALAISGVNRRDRYFARLYLREQCSWLGIFDTVLESACFNLTVCALIFANAVHIGVVCNLSANNAFLHFIQQTEGAEATLEVVGDWAWVLDMFFGIAFAVEITVRMLALELRFFVGYEWRWNLFDVGLVLSSITELSFSSSQSMNWNLSFIRVVRVLRLVRSFRMIRILRFASVFRELRLMLLAILSSAKPLLWAILLLVFIVYLFAVLFLQALTHFLEDARPADTENFEEMQTFFHSLPMTLLSLFMAISGGVSWWEVVRPIIDVSIFYVVLFLLFVVIMLLAVMNIITGIFVGNAVERASMDRDIASHVEKERNAINIEALRDLFREIDRQGTGHITLRDFQTMLETEEVKTVLTILDLDIFDAVAFFKILDVDENSRIEIDEFVMGCMRYMGKAKTVDIETLIQENRRMMRRSSDQSNRIEQRLNRMEEIMKEFGTCITLESVKGPVMDMEHRIRKSVISDWEQLESLVHELQSSIRSNVTSRRRDTSKMAHFVPWCFSEPVEDEVLFHSDRERQHAARSSVQPVST